MAKRKRLTPPKPDFLDTPAPEPESKSLGFPATQAPIAQVAGDASMAAALDELSAEMKQARTEGRLIETIPLNQIDPNYIERDRIHANDTQLAELVDSIRERGQQIPIEVIRLDKGQYGLISGWRRITALKLLYDETSDPRYGVVQAILRRPDSASDAYVAMVEENELRVGLSYYERARIAAKAVEHGVYDSEKQALLKLFSTASRAKRSKIRSFLPIYHALDMALKFPGAINERLGARLSRALEDVPGFAGDLRATLVKTPAENAEMERALLETALRDDGKKQSLKLPSDTVMGRVTQKDSGPVSQPVPARPASEISVAASADKVVLSGPGVTPAFLVRLRSWLDQQA